MDASIMQRRQSTGLQAGCILANVKGRDATFANCSVRFIHRPLIYGLILCPSLIRSKGWPYHNGPTFIMARCSSAVHTSVPVVGHKYATRSNILLSRRWKNGVERENVDVNSRSNRCGFIKFFQKVIYYRHRVFSGNSSRSELFQVRISL